MPRPSQSWTLSVHSERIRQSWPCCKMHGPRRWVGENLWENLWENQEDGVPNSSEVSQSPQEVEYFPEVERVRASRAGVRSLGYQSSKKTMLDPLQASQLKLGLHCLLPRAIQFSGVKVHNHIFWILLGKAD